MLINALRSRFTPVVPTRGLVRQASWMDLTNPQISTLTKYLNIATQLIVGEKLEQYSDLYVERIACAFSEILYCART